MSITPRQLDSVPDRVVALFAALDDEMRGVAARAMVDPAVNRAKVRDAIARISASNRTKISNGVRDSLRDAAKGSLAKDELLYERARIAGLIGPYTPISRVPEIVEILKRGILSTQTLGNIVRTSAEQRVYEGFIAALDTATLRIVTGQAAPAEAIREAVKELATMTTRVTYMGETGRRVTSSLYPAVRRSVLTGAAQTTARLTMARALDVGITTFAVSAHMGARPEHAEWQGGIYTADELVSVCGYGDGAGLAGWNCRHQMTAWLEGISSGAVDIDPDMNEEQYELSQRQRACERNIRAYKSRANVYREAEHASKGDVAAALKADKDAATAKVRKWQAERDSIVSKRGGRARTDREVATIR